MQTHTLFFMFLILRRIENCDTKQYNNMNKKDLFIHSFVIGRMNRISIMETNFIYGERPRDFFSIKKKKKQKQKM